MSKTLTSMSKKELIAEVESLREQNAKAKKAKTPTPPRQKLWSCTCGNKNTGFGIVNGEEQGKAHPLNAKGQVRKLKGFDDKKSPDFGKYHEVTFLD